MQYLYAALAVIASSVATPVIAFFALQYLRLQKVPEGIPWVDLRGRRWFPKWRATLGSLSHGREPLKEGHDKYGKHGKPFILPGLHWPEVVLPPSNVKWMASQSEDVLNGTSVQDDLIGLEYFTHGPTLESIHDFSTISRDLTRQMSKLVADEMDEIDNTFTKDLGTDTEEWKTVKAVELLKKASQRTVNRIFVGLPLCRDELYRKAGYWYAIAFSIASVPYRYLIPHPLKPLFGPLLAPPVQLIQWFAARRSIPLIKIRLAKLRRSQSCEKLEIAGERPDDMLQWIVEAAARKPDPREASPWNIAKKLLLFGHFATFTTMISVSTALVDILAYPRMDDLIYQLREEAERIMPKLASDPRAVREMVKMDSVIRESLRLRVMFGYGMHREVACEGGVTTPDGLHLPKGSHVATSVCFMQQDSVEQGDQFEPLRYYNEAINKKEQSLDGKQTMAAQISDTFLSFSLGKHACPGRFFAIQTLKLMLGYLLTHYDFQPIADRAKCDTTISEVVMISDKADIRVKRRKQAGPVVRFPVPC